jgi:hypothetical protein
MMNLDALAMVCLTLVVCVAIISNTVTRIKTGKWPHRYQYLLDEQRQTFELYGGKQLKVVEADEPSGESPEPPDYAGPRG